MRGGRNLKRGGNLRRSEKRGCEDRQFEKKVKRGRNMRRGSDMETL